MVNRVPTSGPDRNRCVQGTGWTSRSRPVCSFAAVATPGVEQDPGAGSTLVSMSSGHPDAAIAAALARLDLIDPIAAIDARAALAWIVGDAGLEAVSQYGLQQFCWYELPFKWLVEPAVRADVVDALGSFFDLAGMSRYAKLCRSATTSAVLEAWLTDPSTGFGSYRAAGEASGVEPPALPELRWGSVMSAEESDAFWSTALALEVAIEASEIRPGTAGWRERQAEVTRAHLGQARDELFGASLLQTVHTARLAEWIEGPLGLASLSRARIQVVSPVANALLHPVAPPRGLARMMRPLTWFLDQVAGQVPGAADAGEGRRPAPGIVLTPKGHLPRALAIEAARAFPSWWDWSLDDHLPRREDDLPPLVAIHDLARQLKLVRRAGRHLVLTKRGQAMRSDSVELWRSVAGYLTAGSAFSAAVNELVLAIVVLEPLVKVSQIVAEVMVVLTESGWQDGASGEPVPLVIVETAVDEVLALATVFGWTREKGRQWPVRQVRLTEAGRATALAALRQRALAPRSI